MRHERCVAFAWAFCEVRALTHERADHHGIIALLRLVDDMRVPALKPWAFGFEVWVHGRHQLALIPRAARSDG